MINIVLFGPPGAGKGTQSDILIKKYNLVHISTGDIFRSNIKSETDLGKLAKSYMDKGQLVPDEVTIKMLESTVDSYKDANGFIFDGYPRNTNQAEALDSFLLKKRTAIIAMLALNVPEIELKNRLSERAKTSGRIDDANPIVIQKRIDVYNNETSPVINFYRNQGKYIEIEGVGTIDQISKNLFDAIATLL
jgi:adenylate kinase